MKPFLSVWFRNWKLFFFSAIAGVSLFAVIYAAFNRIEAEAQLISTSMYKDAPSQMPWAGGSVMAAVAGDNAIRGELKDLSLWLKSYDFLKEFLAENCAAGEAKSFCAGFGANPDVAPLRLMGAVSSQIDEGKILRVRAGADDAVQASELANALAAQLVGQKRKLETLETERLQRVLVVKKAELEGRLRDSLKVMARAVGSGAGPSLRYDVEKPLGFLSEMQTRAAEIDLQIAENERVMSLIRTQAAKGDEGSDYGPTLRIANLETENRILAEKKKTLSMQIQKSLSAQYVSGPAGEALNPVMEQYRADVENHAAVIKALTKAQLTVSVNESPVESFQKASPILARDRWSLSFMLALGLFLSQLIAVGGFLLAKMWQDRPAPRSLRFHAESGRPESGRAEAHSA